MKFLNDDVPIRRLKSLLKSVLTKRGLAFLVGAVILPVNMAVAEPAAQPNSFEFLAQISSITSLPVLYEKPVEKMTVTATAYNSLAGQTDSTPCIAARGYDLCEADQENVIAANFLPIGAKIAVPELSGDKVYTVVDRMNARYSKFCSGTSCRMDFWMRNYDDARKFGKQTLEIIILSRPE